LHRSPSLSLSHTHIKLHMYATITPPSFMRTGNTHIYMHVFHQHGLYVHAHSFQEENRENSCAYEYRNSRCEYKVNPIPDWVYYTYMDY
jgi:hypothetical protein